MTTDKLTEWRSEAAAVMESIRELEAQLQPLRNRHAELAGLIETESRRRTVVRKMPYNASGKPKRSTKRGPNVGQMAEQFKNLPQSVQATLLKQLEAMSA